MDRDILSRLKFSSTYKFDCYRDDELVWTETKDNLVVNEGLDFALANIFGMAVKRKWYLGLIGAPAVISPNDTMTSHAFEEYQGSVSIFRPRAKFEGAAIVDDTANYVAEDVQTIIGTPGTIHGAFLTSGEEQGGYDGILYGAVMLNASKPVVAGDSLLITITVKATG